MRGAETIHTVAIAGLGAAARSLHLPALAKLGGVRVVAGCDPRVGPGRLHFPVLTRCAEMLAAHRPDLLIVATPPASHAELVRRGLEAGCHVVCEKPLAPTLEEALALTELAERAGRRLSVNQEFRYLEIHRAAHALLGSEEFGELRFLHAAQTFRRDASTEAGWRGSELRRTCAEFGVHVLDLCRFFFGAEPVVVDARMPEGDGVGAPDLLNLIRLELADGRSAQITLDRLTRGRHRYLDLRLDGTRATIETSIGGRLELGAGVRAADRRPFLRLDWAGGGEARLFRGERFRRIARDPLGAFAVATRRLLEQFLASLDGSAPQPCSAADNLGTLALVDACYRSARVKAPIVLGEGRLGEESRGGQEPV